MSIVDDLEKVRDYLNNMIISDKYNTEDILRVSHELDVLLLKLIEQKTDVLDSSNNDKGEKA